MKKIIVFLLLIPFLTKAQSPLQLTVFAGASNYQGDLQPKRYTFEQSNLAIGAGLRYELTERLALRGELRYGKLEATDKMNPEPYKGRNLNFNSKLYEASGLLEYSVGSLEDRRMVPYVFAGLALYHFNPFTFDSTGNKRDLRPLSTEGQGLSQYPDRKMYKLNQLAIPFGVGVRIAANDFVTVGVEVGVRKLFTDYIDDVSKTYVDEQVLLQARGPLAVELAYRGDELKNGAPYPIVNTVRGGPYKDWYYYTGITFGFRLFDLNRSPLERGNRFRTSCPTGR